MLWHSPHLAYRWYDATRPRHGAAHIGPLGPELCCKLFQCSTSVVQTCSLLCLGVSSARFALLRVVRSLAGHPWLSCPGPHCHQSMIGSQAVTHSSGYRRIQRRKPRVSLTSTNQSISKLVEHSPRRSSAQRCYILSAARNAVRTVCTKNQCRTVHAAFVPHSAVVAFPSLPVRDVCRHHLIILQDVRLRLH